MDRVNVDIPSLVANPLGKCDELIRLQLDSSSASGSSGGGLQGSADAVEGFFAQVFSSDYNRSQIPLLNSFSFVGSSASASSSKLPPLNRSLVRCKGMVQDFFDTEFFVAAVRDPSSSNWVCGKYRDVLEINVRDKNMDMNPATSKNIVSSERNAMYVIPIPGEASWLADLPSEDSLMKIDDSVRSSSSDESMMKREGRKRLRDEAGVSNSWKEEVGEEVGEGESESMSCDATTTSSRKFVATQEAISRMIDLPSTSIAIDSFDYNFPDPEDVKEASSSSKSSRGIAPPCIVLLYDNLREGAKLNSCYEFIGILENDPRNTLHPESVSTTGGGEESGKDDWIDRERQVHYPPVSLIPRLHILLITELPYWPRLPIPSLQNTNTNRKGAGGISASSRSIVVDCLTEACLGDKLAAEYVLATISSSVSRREPLIGIISTNLILPSPSESESESGGVVDPASFVDGIRTAICSLVPKCVCIELSLDVLNSQRFVPKKDYDCNRLIAGRLQLSEGTVVLIDETKLSPGQLNEQGLKNLNALKEVISFQKMSYDFEYGGVEFVTDLPVITVSSGSGTLLPISCKLHVNPSSAITPETTVKCSEAELDEARKMFAYVREITREWGGVPESVSGFIESGLQNLRNENQGVSADDLHRVLNIGRMLCATCGACEMTVAGWKQALEMENERRIREKR